MAGARVARPGCGKRLRTGLCANIRGPWDGVVLQDRPFRDTVVTSLSEEDTNEFLMLFHRGALINCPHDEYIFPGAAFACRILLTLTNTVEA